LTPFKKKKTDQLYGPPYIHIATTATNSNLKTHTICRIIFSVLGCAY
jgi:hypothetical protein